MTWKLVSEHQIPDTVFDVLAKYYDATLDKMVLRRFTDCIQVDGRVCVADQNGSSIELTKAGFFPVFWMDVPVPPSGFSEEFWSARGLPVST